MINEIIEKDWKIDLRNEVLKAITGKIEEKLLASLNFHRLYCDKTPTSLFKYYSDKRLNSIKESKLWYSEPCKFNDVFDSDIAVDKKALFQEMVRLSPNQPVIPGSPRWKHLNDGFTPLLKILHKNIDEIKTSKGVACFSEKCDSLLMWAHYADNHQGMCVEYDLVKMVKELNLAPIPVIYSNERVILNKLNPSTVYQDAHAKVIEGLTTKSLDWSYENEWRVIHDKDAYEALWDYDNNGVSLDMIKPTSITLGCEARMEFEIEVKKYCKESKINLYKMEKDAVSYKLNKKPILEY